MPEEINGKETLKKRAEEIRNLAELIVIRLDELCDDLKNTNSLHKELEGRREEIEERFNRSVNLLITLLKQKRSVP